MFIIALFKKILLYLFYFSKIKNNNILYNTLLLFFFFFPKQIAFCESFESPDNIDINNNKKYYYIAGIFLVGICITIAIIYFNNDSSLGAGANISQLPDVVVQSAYLPPQHVLVHLSNTDPGMIHWSNYRFQELMTMPPSTPVAFINYTPKFDQDSLQIIYTLIDIKTLKSMALKASTHF